MGNKMGHYNSAKYNVSGSLVGQMSFHSFPKNTHNENDTKDRVCYFIVALLVPSI